jgi:HEPN domain-containing protein
MMQLERPEVLAWWALSNSDIRVAAVVAELQPPEWHLVCFLAQQAAEKAMEAGGLPVPRTHDLVLLVERLPAPAGAVLDAALLLSAYGVGPRYPSPAGSASERDGRNAIAAAQVLRGWVEGLLA